jgi:hypothetical protein
MTWSTMYHTPFYARFGFNVPSVVPQTNDVRNPAQGMPRSLHAGNRSYAAKMGRDLVILGAI